MRLTFWAGPGRGASAGQLVEVRTVNLGSRYHSAMSHSSQTGNMKLQWGVLTGDCSAQRTAGPGDHCPLLGPGTGCSHQTLSQCQVHIVPWQLASYSSYPPHTTATTAQPTTTAAAGQSVVSTRVLTFKQFLQSLPRSCAGLNQTRVSTSFRCWMSRLLSAAAAVQLEWQLMVSYLNVFRHAGWRPRLAAGGAMTVVWSNTQGKIETRARRRF